VIHERVKRSIELIRHQFGGKGGRSEEAINLRVGFGSGESQRKRAHWSNSDGRNATPACARVRRTID